MPFEVLTSNPGTFYGVDSTDTVVLPNGLLLTSATHGFSAIPSGSLTFNDSYLQIYGQVYAGGRGIDYWGALSGINSYNNNTIFVGEAGVVSAVTFGIRAESGANNQIQNYGQISGGTAIESYGGANSVILNGGLISGTLAYGVQVFGEVDTGSGPNTMITNLAGGTISGRTAAIDLRDLVGGSSITNHGIITSSLGVGIHLNDAAAGQSIITVTNHGTVSGLVTSYLGSVNIDKLTNRGDMIGDVLMGDGSDTFDNRRGAVDGDVDLGAGNDIFDNRDGFVSGEVLGGAGNDLFRGDADLAETFFGGAGNADVLDFRYGPGVVIALDGAFGNGGAAVGDVYAQVEWIYGSSTEADTIRGNSAANYLYGLGGNDILNGAGGGDTLRGGPSADNLTGGSGNDTFRYMTIAECGDVITDFSSSAVGNNDRFQFSAAGFGGGLVAGALAASQFRTRADNLAQDADDRFIFRTNDRTLWYDADGNDAGAAVMIADLHAAATVTAADIFII